MQISQHGSGHNVCLQFVAGIALHHLVVFSQWLLTPVKTTMEHSRPAFRDLPRTGDAEPVDRGKIWLRTIEDDLRPLNFGLKTRDGKAARFI